MEVLEWTITLARFWMDCEWPTFLLFVILYALLLALFIYRLILSIPFGRSNLGDNLIYTATFFLTFWLISYTLINLIRFSLLSWIPVTAIVYQYVSYAFTIILPTVIYLYILYVSYIGNPYLTANDLRYQEQKRLRSNS